MTATGEPINVSPGLDRDGVNHLWDVEMDVPICGSTKLHAAGFVPRRRECADCADAKRRADREASGGPSHPRLVLR